MKPLIIIFILLPLYTFSQNTTSGVYAYSGGTLSHKLHLMNDSNSVLHVSSCLGTYKYVGKWSQKNDTIIVIENLVNSNLTKEKADTIYFKISSPTSIKRFYLNPDKTLPSLKYSKAYEKR